MTEPVKSLLTCLCYKTSLCLSLVSLTVCSSILSIYRKESLILFDTFWHPLQPAFLLTQMLQFWSMSIELHGKFLLGRLLLLQDRIGSEMVSLFNAGHTLGNNVKPQKMPAFSRQCITRIANLMYTCPV